MNVRCPTCVTVFRVDPARVPTTGVRARCAVCATVIAVGGATGIEDDFAGIGGAGAAAPTNVSEAPAMSPGESGAELRAVLAEPPAPVVAPSPAAAAAPPPAPVAPEARRSVAASPPMGVPPRESVVPSAVPPRPSTARAVEPSAPIPIRPPNAPPAGGPAKDLSGGVSPSRPPLFAPRAPAATPAPQGRAPMFAPRVPKPAPAMPPAQPAPVAADAGSVSGTLAQPARPSVAAAAPTPRQTPPVSPPSSSPAKPRPVNPFLANDPNAKARRLARALVSDLASYFPQRRAEGVANGTLRDLFKEEIRKSYDEYVQHVGRELAESTAHFRDALNEILAGGQQVF